LTGGLATLNENEHPVSLIPWISENWKNHFNWNGRGEFTRSRKSQANTNGSKRHMSRGAKFVSGQHPKQVDFWKMAYEAKLDFINTDQIGAATANFI
jgi:hypothetical protein